MVFFACFFSNLYLNIFESNSGEPDQTPHSVSSDRGFPCLSMSHKTDGTFMSY